MGHGTGTIGQARRTRRTRRVPSGTAMLAGAAACALAVSTATPALADVGSVNTGAGSAAGVAGGSLGDALSATPDPQNTPFYTDPAETENDPGRVIRTEPTPLVTEAAGAALAGAGSAGSVDATGSHTTTERVMYESTDRTGAPVATTGLYIRNDGPVPERFGARPLAVLSPGTQGIGDQCAPSKTMPPILDLQFSPGLSIGAGYEILQAHYFLARGFSVFVPDFEGTGTPDASTYLTRDAMAHATLDGARAATRLPDSGLGPDTKVALFGHSQGGGATAAAAELQSEYAADVHVVGAAASGPPGDLVDTSAKLDGGTSASILGMLANGFSAAYPENAERIRGVFNDAGLAMVDRMAASCAGDGIAAYGLADSRTWTKDGRSFTENVTSDPVLADMFAAQRIGLRPPKVPTAVIQEPNDDFVPTGQVERMVSDWCAGGSSVDYLQGTLPPVLPNSGIVHIAADLHPRGADWLADRVAGIPAPSTCAE